MSSYTDIYIISKRNKKWYKQLIGLQTSESRSLDLPYTACESENNISHKELGGYLRPFTRDILNSAIEHYKEEIDLIDKSIESSKRLIEDYKDILSSSKNKENCNIILEKYYEEIDNLNYNVNSDDTKYTRFLYNEFKNIESIFNSLEGCPDLMFVYFRD